MSSLAPFPPLRGRPSRRPPRLRFATTLGVVVSALVALVISAPAGAAEPSQDVGGAEHADGAEGADASAPPTAEEAAAFVQEAEERLARLGRYQAHAEWLAATYINVDSQAVAARAQEEVTSAGVELAKRAARFDDVDVAEDVRRKLDALKLALSVPAPSDPELIAELAEKSNGLTAIYGSHRYCPEDEEQGEGEEPAGGGEPGDTETGETPEEEADDCLAEPDMVRIMAESRDPERLLDIWKGWRTMAPPMRDDYLRVIDIANRGARELGYDDLGVMWRSGYDLDPDVFAAEGRRLLEQIQPLYEQLHCHVRARLRERYGADVVPGSGPIPAHLLGNMWAQSWSNVYDMVSPVGADVGHDLTGLIVEADMGPLDMVETGENFFVSLGFEPLPETFWERSMFTKPRDRDVVCHASAWDMGDGEDYRIKMCIQRTADDFSTIHHELGHNFYQRAYREQPYLFQGGANPGFHEAIGDAVALSITPEYLVEIGLLDEAPDASEDIGLLLNLALDKVAILPWTYLVDQWRWGVASGEIDPGELNSAWWELRRRYQGIAAPEPRGEEHFDPGAKYHIPAMVEYTRYFVAGILQFQFHRALCDIAGEEGPLHRCSIFGNEEAGRRLNDMLEMGSSRPWPEALEALTGKREMDATAILDYFAPLQAWLERQNAGRQCGW